MEKEYEKIIKDLNNIKKIYIERLNMYEHFYSGDQDTFIEAYNSVLDSKYNMGEYYDHNQNDRENYSDIYKNEINIEYNRLCLFGKEIGNKINSAVNKISDLIKFEEDYMSIDEKRKYLIDIILKDKDK